MQKLFLIGRLGKDARIVETQNGSRFVSFTMAVNSKNGNVEKTTWYDVRSFNYSEKMVPYFTKGSSLIVTGDLDATIEENNGKNYLRLSVLADSINFNNNGGNQNTEQGTSASPATQSHEERPVEAPISMGVKQATVQEPTVVQEPVVFHARTSAVEPSNSDSDLPF